MSTGHRFFFIISCTFLFAGAFVLGITILPIICGLRYCCARVREPEAPVKPTDPIKPTKPEEPKIGASNEEWTEYRKNMSEYRAKKTKWKEDHKYFKENQSKLILQWEKENRAHNKKVAEYKAKVVNPAKQAFCFFRLVKFVLKIGKKM